MESFMLFSKSAHLLDYAALLRHQYFSLVYPALYDHQQQSLCEEMVHV